MLFITQTTDQSLAGDVTGIASNFGFIPNADGNVELRGQNDAADRTVYCLAGHWYKIDVERFTAAGTTATQVAIVTAVDRRGG